MASFEEEKIGLTMILWRLRSSPALQTGRTWYPSVLMMWCSLVGGHTSVLLASLPQFLLYITHGHSSCFGLVSSLAVFSVRIFLVSKKPAVGNLGILLTVSGSLGSNFFPCKLSKPFARIKEQTQVCAKVPTHMYLWLLALFSSLIMWVILSHLPLSKVAL